MRTITPFAYLSPLNKSAADIAEAAKETLGAGAGAAGGAYGGVLAGGVGAAYLTPKSKGFWDALEILAKSMAHGGAAGLGLGANAGAELLGADKGGLRENASGTVGGILGAYGGGMGAHRLQEMSSAKGKGSGVAILAALLAGTGGALAGRAIGKPDLDKQAAEDEETKEAPKPKEGEGDIRRQRDEKALRNRHIALALKRGGQGGLLGAILGGLKATNSDNMTWQGGALTGGLGGALVGGGIGAAEGGIKRTLGLDPILDTTLIAQRA